MNSFQFFEKNFVRLMPVEGEKKRYVKRKELFSILPNNMGKLHVSSGRGILAQ